MTNEEKQLLLIDLCARLPYGVICQLSNKDAGISITEKLELGGLKHFIFGTMDVLPYLRPMSSMTDDERAGFRVLGGVMSYSPQHDTWAISAFSPEAYDWLNRNGFDYRGLIPMGLALEAKEGMYKTE